MNKKEIDHRGECGRRDPCCGNLWICFSEGTFIRFFRQWRSGVCGFCDIDHGTWKRYRTAEPFRRCGGAAENGDDQTVIRQKGKKNVM